jgi:acetyl esterase/lipase
MKKVLPFLLATLTACGTTHLGRPAKPAPSRERAHIIQESKDLVYTPKNWPAAQLADIYRPVGTGPWPAVLLLHPGGWRGPERREVMAHTARRLARRGYVVMNLTYSLAPERHYPAPCDDVLEARRWLRRNAAGLHVLPDQVAIFGYSSGGQLAALMGGMDAAPQDRFQAVVAGGVPTDLRKFSCDERLTDFLGGTKEQIPAVYAQASPITHVTPDDPPVFLYHGGKDTLVPVDHATDYYAALQKAGVPVELFWLEGRGHFRTFITQGAAITAAIEFLDRHLARH